MSNDINAIVGELRKITDNLTAMQLNEPAEMAEFSEQWDKLHQLLNLKTVISFLDALEDKTKKEIWLKEQLAGLANFNPDWDMLQATQESLREHTALLNDAQKRIAELEQQLAAQNITVNDDMALAFHNAIYDSSMGSDEAEDIKTGLRAALCNVTMPQSVPVVTDEMTRDWVTCPICNEPDMQKETDSNGNSLIQCVNHRCASNNAAMLSTSPATDTPACPKCRGTGSYHCLQMLGSVDGVTCLVIDSECDNKKPNGSCAGHPVPESEPELNKTNHPSPDIFSEQAKEEIKQVVHEVLIEQSKPGGMLSKW